MTVVKSSFDQDRVSALQAELFALELWDGHYYCTKVHDKVDDDSFRARKKRREEVLEDIRGIVGTNLAAFRPPLS